MITPRRCLPVLLLSVAGAVSTVHAQGGEIRFTAPSWSRASCSPKTRPGSLQVSVECEAERARAAGQPVKASMRSARHVQVRVDPLPAREGAQGKTRHYVVTLSYL